MSTEVMRFKCPVVGESKERRIKNIMKQIDEWISSEELSRLVGLFGGKIDRTVNFIDRINYLNEFVGERWDFRKNQANGGERWEIEDTPFVMDHSKEIMSLLKRLGFMDISKPCIVPDYILPLGGARMANLFRCEYAKELYDSFHNKDIPVIALCGKRKLNTKKKDSDGKTEYDIITEEYSKDAGTEYDAINSGLEHAFGLYGTDYSEEGVDEENHNLSWCIRKYNSDIKVYAVAAPTTDAGRRANSMDTFEYFMKKFEVKEGANVLLVTSTIYVPYQFLKFMKLAIEHNLYLDCVGPLNAVNGKQFSRTSNYLQETKGTINAIKSLVDEYYRD